jgi:peptidoglycan/LPS O-acetylase OafA/YrhL
MNTQPDPAEALAAIAEARRNVHDRVATHGWRYDLTYAGLVAVMVGAQSLDQPYGVTGVALGVAGLAVIFQRETRRTGVRVTGVSPRRARWVAIGLGLLMAAAMMGMVALRHLTPPGFPLVPAVLAVMVLAFAAALIGSRVWRRVYRAEMGAGE